MQRHSPLLLLSLLLLSGGCSTGTDPGPCEEVECRRITHFTSISYGVQRFSDSAIPFFRIEATIRSEGGITDQIRPASGGIEVSSVRYNGISLQEFIQVPGPFTTEGVFYRRNDADLDSTLAPPGDENRWVIIPPGYRDSIVLTVPTPIRPAKISTMPNIPVDTLDPKQDLQISWPPSTSDGEERNTVLIFLVGAESFQTIPIDSTQGFTHYTDRENITISSDSLQAWRGRFSRVDIELEHITIRDYRLNENEWGRALLSETDKRQIHFPVE